MWFVLDVKSAKWIQIINTNITIVNSSKVKG